jgi:hypothetical protein
MLILDALTWDCDSTLISSGPNWGVDPDGWHDAQQKGAERSSAHSRRFFRCLFRFFSAHAASI